VSNDDYGRLDAKLDTITSSISGVAVDVGKISQWANDHEKAHETSDANARWALRTAIAAAGLVVSVLVYLGVGGV